MLAVLEDGILAYQANIGARDDRGRKLFGEAKDWISEKDPYGLFSFENICEALGLSPSYVRQGLVKWKGQKLPYNSLEPAKRTYATR